MTDIEFPRRIAGAPEGWDAKILADLARSGRPLLHVAESRRRLDFLVRAVAFFAPDLDVVSLPAWDCRPYDRLAPGLDVMARRMAGLTRLAAGMERQAPPLVITTVGGLLRRVPPRSSLQSAKLVLSVGQAIDSEGLPRDLARLGYVLLPEADEPAEAAMTGTALTVYRAPDWGVVRAEFPSGRTLDRLLLDGEPVERVELGAASELLLDEPARSRFESAYSRLANGGAETDPLPAAVRRGQRPAGLEHWLPLFHDSMDSLLDWMPDCSVSLDERVPEVRALRLAEIAEAYRRRLARRDLDLKAGLAPYHPAPLERAFLTAEEWDAALADRPVTRLDDDPPDPGEPTGERQIRDAGGRRLDGFPAPDDLEGIAGQLEQWRTQGRRIIVGVDQAPETPVLARLIRRRGMGESLPVDNWPAAEALPPGVIIVAELPLEGGLTAPDLAVVARSDLLRQVEEQTAAPLPEPPPLTFGTLVVHPEHGIGLADGLERVEAGDGAYDCLRLLYRDGDTLLVPAEGLDLLHPYDRDRGAAALDRLGGSGWSNRLDKARTAAEDIARSLIEAAAKRSATRQEPVRPARRSWRAFLSGFPYTTTPDQEEAIATVLADLASGRSMDRLVVGDVGVGKTEVALRAAFAVAMAGRQVAVIAPTTPLARQHLEDFADRFAGFDIQPAFLGRGQAAAEARAVKTGLADGTIRLVVGTHALLAQGIRFRDLGLLVLDEEHRFGVKQKERLRDLSSRVHSLAMSATPIPRTLRLALAGLRDVSVIATPPGDRRPVRTEAVPLTDTVLRDALRRERARGGQSFVIAPRIADLAGLRGRLEAAVPELSVVEAHGRLKPEELEQRIDRFVQGGADILLATNIVETGLDIPNANTILIHRAQQFGLAQLHQLRGRVGRSRIQAHAWLTWPEDDPPGTAGMERLQTLAALTGPGAGWAVAERDMELRGGGDLLGEAQAGHVKDVGPALFQVLLRDAVSRIRGQSGSESWSPRIVLDRPALIPPDYVPDAARRLALYARLSHMEAAEQRPALEAEIRRQYGPLPPEAETLLDLGEMKVLCRRSGVAALEIGPKGAVFTMRDGAGLPGTERRADGKLRLTWEDPADRLQRIGALLRHATEERSGDRKAA